MARPKTGKPVKTSLNLTVSKETREALNLISEHHQESISALVERWAAEEIANIANQEPSEGV